MLKATLEQGGLLTFLIALVVSLLATPLARRLAIRLQFVDHPAEHKFHGQATPYLGGVAVGLAVLVALSVAAFSRGWLRLELAAIALGGLALAGVGLIDDWRDIGAVPRVVVQALAGLVLWAFNVRVTVTGVGAVDLALTVLVVLAVTNAINLLDHIDGLSTGTVAIASIAFFVIAGWRGQSRVAVMALALAGGCLGFLPHNFNRPRAHVFLGDTGTLFIGFVMASLIMNLRLSGAVVSRVTIPLLLLVVPLFDMTLVVFSRWRAGLPPWNGGLDHTSHRLVTLGLTHRAAVVAMYGMEAVGAGIALAVTRFRAKPVTWAALTAGIVVAVALIWLLEKVPVPRGAGRPSPEQEAGAALRAETQPQGQGTVQEVPV